MSMAMTWTTSFYEFFCLHRKNLLLNLVRRNFKVKFKGSVLGYFWTLVIPISQVVVFYFVYQVIMKVPVPHYLAFVVTGILPWVFFSTTVNESLESLVSGQTLLSQLPVPLQAFPAATVAANFISFWLAYPIMVAAVAFSGITLSWTIVLFFPLTLLLLVYAYSLSFILAALFVLFRDIKHIFGIFIMLWMYVTPILYSIDMVPQQWRWTIYFNPMSGFFISMRDLMINGKLPPAKVLAVFFGWTVLTFFIANVMRVTIGPRLAEKL